MRHLALRARGVCPCPSLWVPALSAAAFRGLWLSARRGRAGMVRLSVRAVRRDPERCATNMSFCVISPSVSTAKLPVARCWG
jgi:hypothetical protein